MNKFGLNTGSQEVAPVVIKMESINETVKDCFLCKNEHKDLVFVHRFGTVDRKTQDVFIVGERPGQAAGRNMELSSKQYENIVSTNPYGALICELDLNWERVYYANLVKCAARDNRESSKFEIQNCQEYLNNQIDLKKPKVIIACGKPTCETFGGTKIRVGADAGKTIKWKNIPVIISPNPTGTYFKVNRKKIIPLLKNSLKKVLGNKSKQEVKR